jgi:Uncharacterized conserved protein
MTRVYGPTVDDETRCIHYRTSTDIIAIRFGAAVATTRATSAMRSRKDHEARQWPVAERETKASCAGCARPS